MRIQLTENSVFKWAMVGAIALIFVLLPESPWWLVSKGKLDEVAKVLKFCNGKVDGYDVQEQIVHIISLDYSVLTSSRMS